jgi:hypothetical protein
MGAVMKAMIRADGFNNVILGDSHDGRFVAVYYGEVRSQPEYERMRFSVVMPCLRRPKNANQGETDETRREMRDLRVQGAQFTMSLPSELC